MSTEKGKSVSEYARMLPSPQCYMEVSLAPGSPHNSKLQELQAIILAPKESNFYSNRHIRMALQLLLRHKQLVHKGTSETCCVRSALGWLCFFEELSETRVAGC